MKRHAYVTANGEQASWKWLADLAIGEESEPLAEGAKSAHVVAKRLGISIRTRKQATGDFVIKRIA